MYKGVTQKGKVSYSKNQIKKHINQLSMDEKKFIYNHLSKISISDISYSTHVVCKKNNTYSKEQIYTIINNIKNTLDNLIEVNINYDKFNKISDIRVLLRDDNKYLIELYDKNTQKTQICYCNLCVVISIYNNKIITTYWNRCDDKHNTIDWNRYEKNIDIKNCWNRLKGVDKYA